MSRSSEYWDKISHLFDICRDHPPEDWDLILFESGEPDKEIILETLKLLHNNKNAKLYFSSLRERIETDLSRNENQHTLKEGAMIDKYRIKEIISQGSMACVYLAERDDGQFQQTVAIKIIKPSGRTGKPGSNFGTEQQILANFNHPNIARFYDGGITNDGFPYIVMEYIEGLPLDQYCERNKLKLYYRLKLFMQVCEAIQYAHNNFIIHRDLKPQNILVSKDGQVKLVDFGISSVMPDGQSEGNSVVVFSGTISYASPEQIEGKKVLPASDVYQMGKVLYKIITGVHPNLVKYNGIKNRPITSPDIISRLLKDKYYKNFPLMVRNDICALLEKSMEVNPGSRYVTADSFRTDLKNLLNCLPLHARRLTWIYRMNKFYRRNKTYLLFVIALFTGLSSALVSVTLKANRLKNEKHKTEIKLGIVMGNISNIAPSYGIPLFTGKSPVTNKTCRIECLKHPFPTNREIINFNFLPYSADTCKFYYNYTQAEILHSRL